MSTLKMLRELKRRLKAEGVHMDVEMRKTGHPKLIITLADGRVMQTPHRRKPF